MDPKYFPLGPTENNRLIKIMQVIFGVVCIAVAIFWLVFNIRTLKVDVTLWITIIFLSGFGFYQVWSGLGYAARFIHIGPDKIRLKKNAILPVVVINAGEIERIELLTLNIIFFFKTKKRILLRFGTTYHETNEMIVDEIISFAGLNRIPYKIIEEKL